MVEDIILWEAENADGNISENSLRLAEEKRGLYSNFLRDRSYDNKKKEKEEVRELKLEVRRSEMEAMNKNAKYLENVAGWHSSYTWYRHVKNWEEAAG